MSDHSKIEWTDASWNPIRARNLKTGAVGWHCEHATTGCEHCYSEGFNKRLGTGLDFKPGHRKDVEIFLDEQMLTQPLRWKKPRKIFVCSMTDAFAGFVTDEMLDKMFAVMALCAQHTFQVLTKRAGRMRDYFATERAALARKWARAVYEADVISIKYGNARVADERQKVEDLFEALCSVDGFGWPLPNVWLGVSAELQQEANARIPELLNTPASVRFVSLEPLLGPISLHALNLATPSPCDALRGVQCANDSADGFRNEPITKLDWVIVGGESGREARPMHPDWAQSLRDWCQATNVPFFFKQWGEYAPATFVRIGSEGEIWRSTPDGKEFWFFDELNASDAEKVRPSRVGKAKAGRLLDGVEHNAFPRATA